MSEKTDKTSPKKGPDKYSEGRKFAVISPQSIVMLAESCGISGLNEDIAGKIGEDATYRLREIIHGCSVHMRHTNERILRSTDVARVLPNSSEMQVHGYLSGGSSNFLYVPDADVFVNAYNELTVNLSQIALQDKTYVQKGDHFVRGMWFLPDPGECATPHEECPSTSSAEPVTAPSVPAHLVSYYNTFAKVLLCNHGKVLATVLQDLQRNTKIILIVPYFLNFLIEGLQELPRGSDACENLLLMLHSLTMNPHVYRDAAVVVSGLLTCLLVYAVDPLPSEIVSASKDIEHRELAADAVVKVLVHWYGSDDSMMNNILHKMQVILSDPCNSVRSHLGALLVLCSFGEGALNRCFWPHIGKYLDFVSQLPADLETLELEGCVLKAAGLMYSHTSIKGCNDFFEERNILLCRKAVCDRVLYTYFGDSLCTQWRYPFQQKPMACHSSGKDDMLNSNFRDSKIDFEEFPPIKRERSARTEIAKCPSSWDRQYHSSVQEPFSASGLFDGKNAHYVSEALISSCSRIPRVDESLENSVSKVGVVNKRDIVLNTCEVVPKDKRWESGNVKSSGGSMNEMFELFMFKKKVVTLHPIRGLPVRRELRRREVKLHQLFTNSFYHRKCLQMKHVGKISNFRTLAWSTNYTDVLNSCL